MTLGGEGEILWKLLSVESLDSSRIKENRFDTYLGLGTKPFSWGEPRLDSGISSEVFSSKPPPIFFLNPILEGSVLATEGVVGNAPEVENLSELALVVAARGLVSSKLTDSLTLISMCLLGVNL